MVGAGAGAGAGAPKALSKCLLHAVSVYLCYLQLRYRVTSNAIKDSTRYYIQYSIESRVLSAVQY